jgi:hypothetical protein
VSPRKQPKWASRVLAAIHHLARRCQIRFSAKAAGELALLGFGLDEEDAVQVLSTLKLADLVGRVESKHTPEWLYVFKPRVGGITLYVKLIVRGDCVVISFHEDEEDDEEF